MANYVVYHLHSDLSNGVTNIDSITNYHDYIEYAKSLKMEALGFSEHGSVLSWVNKKKYIEEAGMKYIHAEEFYLTDVFFEYPLETPSDVIESLYGKSKEERDKILADFREAHKTRVRREYHIILIAKNDDGVLELNKLSSTAFLQDGHFYYRPRITFDELEHTSNNIIVTTACIAGALCKGTDEIKDRLLRFLIRNKHRCYLEIQHHNVPIQKQYNQYLAKISEEYNIPLIAGTDTHCLNKIHELGRAILQKSKDVHFDDEEGWDLTFKTYDELVDAYRIQGALPEDVFLQAIQNTNVMSSKIETFELDHSYKYPKLYEDSESVLWQKIKEGIKERGIDKYPNYEEYVARINHEVDVFKHNGAIDFILLEEDYKRAAREMGIRYGYSRGSVSGSIVCYLLKITEVDSIKYDLNFDRFMNIERISLADIDSDWYKEDRDKVREYLFNKRGLYCCNIITFNTIKMRGAIKDVGRALGMTPQETQEICNKVNVDKPDDEDEGEAEDEEEPSGREYVDEKVREKYPELFKYVDIVYGTIVSLGRHAAGLVVSPYEVDDRFGTLYISSSDRPVSQINMKEIDGLNYVKLDLLGLDCVGLIYKTCDMVGIPFLTPDNMDFNDKAVWDDLKKDTTTIFQYESEYASNYLRSILQDNVIEKIKSKNPNFSYIDVMSMANGAIRPAGASYRDKLAAGEYNDCGHPAINKHLASTLSFLVYQEQIISFLHTFCGFTMGEADVVRRCVDENTYISLANGNRKKIRDIEVGDLVQTFDNNNISCYRKVNNVYDNGIQEIFKIKASQFYELNATGTHKILTQRGWVRVDELNINDYIFVPRNNNSWHDKAVAPNRRIDKTDMFLLGIMIGDGSMGDANDIHFTNSDLELIEIFKYCVNRRPKHDKSYSCEFSIYTQNGVNVDKIYTIRAITKKYKKSLSGFLSNLGVCTKSAGKHIPSEIMSYPPCDKTLYLLAGLFSTDGGYLEDSKCIEYYTISKQLAYDIHELLLKHQIYSYVYWTKTIGYDYYNYKVRINQKDSLVKFKDQIVPKMVGTKKEELSDIINIMLSSRQSYSYKMPEECKIEIENAFKNNPSISMLSYKIGMNGAGITDVTAKKAVQACYAPYTYMLLNADYIPVPIKSISRCGNAHVYDIEVDETHNYVANGIIVHNCFSKKIGTEEKLPIIRNGGEMTAGHHIKGFVQTLQDDYGATKEEAEAAITGFLKVIEDASDYLFSKNHSDPYSMLGYACAYLRHYYLLEYLTVALNVYASKKEKTAKIKKYIASKHIQIASVKFGFSGAYYTCDRRTNTIYQGIASIKGCNSAMASGLLDVSKRTHATFIDVLKDIIKNNVCNRSQLSTLIKLNFFSEYGEENHLLAVFQAFIETLKSGEVSSLNKDRLSAIFDGIDLKLYANDLKKDGSEGKTWKVTDVDGLMEAVCNSLIDSDKIADATIKEKIEWHMDYLGYVGVATGKPEDLRRVYISAVTPLMSKYGDTTKPWTYRLEVLSIGTGKTSAIFCRTNVFSKSPLKVGNVIYIPAGGLVKGNAKDGRTVWDLKNYQKEC